jgi:hypothetical protein
MGIKLTQKPMSNYDNTNRGALFTNDRKQADNHPDYQGKINVDGTDWEISGWSRTGKSGKKFMSLSVKPPWKPTQERSPVETSRREQAAPADLGNDDFPF